MEVMNGSGQGLRRFRVVNGVRHWLEKPTDEWLAFEKRPSYINRAKKTNNNQANLMNEAQYRFECRKLIFDENVLPKRINNIKEYIPYKTNDRVFKEDDWNLGRCIKCPECNFVHLVYHFEWSDKECHECRKMIEKKKYLIEVKNFKTFNQFFNKEITS